jgi:2-methylcitrate dehydratase
MSVELLLPHDTNQVRGLAQYALDFLAGQFAPPSDNVLARTEQFFVDSVVCGVSALALVTNAPTILRDEALQYPAADRARAATVFGSARLVAAEKAILANCSAVREWDSNGTNFGYDPARGNTAGEFGHNDFYPVVVAAAQQRGWDGAQTLRGMLLLDEIRGRLAEVYSLKTYNLDHVVHGAIASAIVYGAALGATVEQIESAVGMFVAHAIPFRAIRYGKQLSDSKGASAAISTEFAIQAVHRALRGFVGPADIFRNPEAAFCLFEKPVTPGTSPFDLTLATSGDGFAIRGMHFKLGLYEHQSAGAIQGLLDVLAREPALRAEPDQLRAIRVTIYEPAYHIICDPYKWQPTTRQSADHSLPYIVATLLRKAIEQKTADWRALMLLPDDYTDAALAHPLTRALMARVALHHGGHEFDRRYPEGIPTEITLDHATRGSLSSGMIMFPTGHAGNTTAPLAELLQHKWQALAALAVDDVPAALARWTNLTAKSAAEIRELFCISLPQCTASSRFTNRRASPRAMRLTLSSAWSGQRKRVTRARLTPSRAACLSSASGRSRG